MEAIQKLEVLPLSKSEIKTFVDAVAVEVMDGKIDPVKLAVYLKSIEETIKAVRDHYIVKDAITDGASLYPEKTFNAFGAEITKTGRTTFDFAQCNDPVINGLYQQQAEIKEVIKAREAVLKTGVDPATGETFIKPLEVRTEFLTIKLK